MKFMKIGTKPDTFFTQESSRFFLQLCAFKFLKSHLSDTIFTLQDFGNRHTQRSRYKNQQHHLSSPQSMFSIDFILLATHTCYVSYMLYSGFHLCLQSYLVPKCGLLRRLCTDSEESDSVTIELNDIPGGADAFELCAKFCYGITINLCAHNLVNALCASKFLRMSDSDSVEKGNLFPKLESFFHSCVLQGWKDSIITLQSTAKLPEWCENLGIIRKCIDSIVEKILTPTAEVCSFVNF